MTPTPQLVQRATEKVPGLPWKRSGETGSAGPDSPPQARQPAAGLAAGWGAALAAGSLSGMARERIGAARARRR